MDSNSSFTALVFGLVLIGILKDVIVLSQWFDRWMTKKQNGNPKEPASLETLTVLMREQSEEITEDVKRSFDKHISALTVEVQKTNDLLRKSLMSQAFIAKAAFGINVPDE